MRNCKGRDITITEAGSRRRKPLILSVCLNPVSANSKNIWMFNENSPPIQTLCVM